MTTDEENERMLKVIEGDPTWQEAMQDLVPLFYKLAISNIVLNEVLKSTNNTHGKLDYNHNSDNTLSNA